tara:strand:+ start:887 stop:2035 length:1149 start_codon:yes stop_codon:yes gene_type:complete
MRILVLTGIRSEYDMLYPVLKELQKDNHISIVVSGAHLSDQHNKTIKYIKKDKFKIVDLIDSLISTDRLVQRSKGLGMLIQGLSQSVERENPDILIVIGDREESIAAGIVANYMNKILVHIGGGDPVYGNSDDPMRYAVSKLAHLHCCIADVHAKNLKKIGEEKFRIFFTGNPSYTNIKNVPKIKKHKLLSKLNIKNSNYIVLIKHPLSSEYEDAYEQMKITLQSLKSFCLTYNYQTICINPNSDPGSYMIRNAIKEYVNENWFISFDTLPRLDFINLIRNSKALIGNSSMGIIESPYYKIPVINVGNRQKGRVHAKNVEFVTYSQNKIIKSLINACLNKIYRKGIKNINNPYGDSSAANKICQAIKKINLKDNKWKIKKNL